MVFEYAGFFFGNFTVSVSWNRLSTAADVAQLAAAAERVEAGKYATFSLGGCLDPFKAK